MNVVRSQREMRVLASPLSVPFGIRISAPHQAPGLAWQLALGLVLLVICASPAWGQTCSQPRNAAFYNGYTLRKIQLKHPLSFIFLVRHRLEKLKRSLPIAENRPFSSTAYDAAFKVVDDALRADDSFGDHLSPAKVVVVTSSIENCQELEGSPKTVDVVYRIFSTDPIPAVRALPEKRQNSVDEPATTAAEDSTKPLYKLRPALGYEDARRLFGGVNLLLHIPGQIFREAHFSGTASPTSRRIDFQLDGSKTPNRRLAEQVEYHLSYSYARDPVSDLSLRKGALQGRFTAVSKSRETSSSRIVLRYGASVEAGNQQANLIAATPPPGTITNSPYGAIRAYAGVTRTTRYSEAAISYGLQVGGQGLGDLSFSKHVGDAVYSRRFPAGTHSPWDIETRLSVGAIRGTRGILVSDRFFGGNSVSSFIPADAWYIPAGPIVRSIPANRLSAGNFGGRSYYSSNFTIGKIVVFRPLVPDEIENADGFGSGINAAENTAERFFADDYLSATQAFKDFAVKHSRNLKGDLDGVQSTLKAIRAAGGITPPLDKNLRDAESLARRIQNIIRHASVPDENGETTPQGLVTLLNPTTSLLLKRGTPPGLFAVFDTLQPLLSPDANSQLMAARASINQHLTELRAALDAIKTGPAGQEAATRAHRDMIRPREIIDSLRHEVNSYSFSVVGIFDVGRVWLDPFGTRYAIGGGGRFSLLNVNFTAGYAVNPHPQKALGQGRGALVFSMTYTNLFR